VSPGAALLAILAGGVIGVGWLQPRLARDVHGVKAREDVYALPPPGELRAMTLGYRAAATDLLWAKLLVENGIHHTERRAFPDLEKYIDGIIALEPDYPPLYRFVDSLLVYRPPRGAAGDARAARRYLERGLAARPDDPKLALQYGQFLAFLAPSFLDDEAEVQRWRRDGADAIMRAVELGADASGATNAAAILSKAGERDAAIAQLRRAYALTDDPALRDDIAARLGSLEAKAQSEAIERDVRYVESQWRREYPFLSRGEFLMLGPPVDPLACAGRGAGDASCARAWDARMPSRSP